MAGSGFVRNWCRTTDTYSSLIYIYNYSEIIDNTFLMLILDFDKFCIARSFASIVDIRLGDFHLIAKGTYIFHLIYSNTVSNESAKL